MTFPTFSLLITLIAVFGARLPLLILAIGLTSWPIIARLVRAELLTLREREFIQAATALGAGAVRVVWPGTCCPTIVPLIVVAAMLRVAYVILVEAGLSYLGVGVPPPTASGAAWWQRGAITSSGPGG